MRTDRLFSFDRRRAPLALLWLVGCTPAVVAHAPAHDAAADVPPADMGVVVARDTGTPDTGGTPTDARVDAPRSDVGMADGGTPAALTFDGQFAEDVWSSNAANPALTLAVTAIVPYDGDVLTSFHYARDDEWLYLGFEGALVTGDAVVAYVDTAPSPPSGVLLTTLGLSDGTNVVTGVLSLGITGTFEFQPEWGWGTSVMPLVATATDRRAGWYELTTAGAFRPLSRDATTFCSATACEVAARLLTLGVEPGGPVRIEVRLGRPGAAGGWSNQTFPASDVGSPEIIGDNPIDVRPG